MPGYLEGQLLIATPLTDGVFTRSVIYICAHDDDGALGVIVNKPLDRVDYDKLIPHSSIDPYRVKMPVIPVYFGGPVEQDHGFILHSYEEGKKPMLPVNNGLAITPNLDMLSDIVQGNGPRKSMLVLGYSGWDAGQLEKEIEDNYWISVPVSEVLVFDAPDEDKWSLAARMLGISDFYNFSETAGHA